MSQTLKRLQTSDFRCPGDIQRLIRYTWRENNRAHLPLHTFVLATNYLSLEICQYLLDNGADPSSAYEDGESALHKAVKLGSKEKCLLLISSGADTLKLWKGLSPLDCAVLYCKTSIRQQLFEVFLENQCFDMNIR